MHWHRAADWCSAETDRHHWAQVESSPSAIYSKYDGINITLVRLLLVACSMFEYTALSSLQLCVPYSPNMTDLLPSADMTIKLKQKIMEKLK